MDLSKFRDKIPDSVNLLNWVVDKTQIVAAGIVAALFVIGVFDFGLLIFEEFKSGEITEVTSVIALIEFLLLLFIVVEVYRTIIAYARNKQPRYVVTLVLYTGVIAIIRRVIVFQPLDIGDAVDAMYVSLSYGIVLLSLGAMLYIIDQYGESIENASIFGTHVKDETDPEESDEDETNKKKNT